MKVEFLFSVVPLVIIGVGLLFTPLLTRRGIFFSATVDPGFPQSSDGRRLLHSYQWQAGLWAILACAIAVLLVPAHPLSAALLPVFLLMAGTGVTYWRTFEEVHTRYGVRHSEIRETSLTPAPEQEEILVWWILPPFLAIAAAAYFLHTHWLQIPPQFPVHWGVNGEPNRWASRDFAGVYGSLLIGTAMNLFFLAFAWVLARISRKTAMRYVTIRMLQVMLYPVTFSFVFAALIPVLLVPTPMIPLVTLLIPAVTLLFATALVFWSYQKIRMPAGSGEVPEPQSDSYWKLGLFYWNPQDPAIFVSKRVGIGFTMNFANKVSWVVLAAVLAIPLLFPLLRGGR